MDWLVMMLMNATITIFLVVSMIVTPMKYVAILLVVFIVTAKSVIKLVKTSSIVLIGMNVLMELQLVMLIQFAAILLVRIFANVKPVGNQRTAIRPFLVVVVINVMTSMSAKVTKISIMVMIFVLNNVKIQKEVTRVVAISDS